LPATAASPTPIPSRSWPSAPCPSCRTSSVRLFVAGNVQPLQPCPIVWLVNAYVFAADTLGLVSDDRRTDGSTRAAHALANRQRDCIELGHRSLRQRARRGQADRRPSGKHVARLSREAGRRDCSSSRWPPPVLPSRDASPVSGFFTDSLMLFSGTSLKVRHCRGARRGGRIATTGSHRQERVTLPTRGAAP
jgi:hypothetical protein